MFGKLRPRSDGRGSRLQDVLHAAGGWRRLPCRPVPETYRHTIRVRFGECDPQEVVFNANWLAYFDVVMTELFRDRAGDYNTMLAAGTDMVVAEVTLRLLGPAGFDDEIDFDVSITRLGNTAMSTHLDASVNGRPVASGDMRHVFIDPATKAKKPMPDSVRQDLAALLQEPAAS